MTNDKTWERLYKAEAEKVERLKEHYKDFYKIVNKTHDKRGITPMRIIDIVCYEYNANNAGVLLHHKKEEAKSVLIYLLKNHTNLSAKDLSSVICLSRGSIDYHYNNVVDRMSVDNVFKIRIEYLVDIIKKDNTHRIV